MIKVNIFKAKDILFSSIFHVRRDSLKLTLVDSTDISLSKDEKLFGMNIYEDKVSMDTQLEIERAVELLDCISKVTGYKKIGSIP